MNTEGQRFGAGLGLSALILAVGAGAQAPKPPMGHTPPAAKAIALVGQVQGTWRQRPPAPDAGREAGGEYELSGNGGVTPLGQIQGTGVLRTTGIIAHSQATGSFTLTGAQGTLTLMLTGPAQAGFSAAPAVMTFSVAGGTGRFAGQQGTGTVHLTMTPQSRAPRIPGRPSPGFVRAAMFTLTFGSPPGHEPGPVVPTPPRP